MTVDEEKRQVFLDYLRGPMLEFAITMRGEAPVWCEAELIKKAELTEDVEGGRALLAEAVEAGDLRQAKGIDGVYWLPGRWMIEAMPRPSPFAFAHALARHLGRRWSISVRQAEGSMGVRERWDDYAPNPGLIAMEGATDREEYGELRDGPLVIVETAPEWVYDLKNRVTQTVGQAFRNHLESPELESLIRGAALQQLDPRVRTNLQDGLNGLPEELQDIARRLLQRIDEIDGEEIVPAQAAPEGLEPPSEWDGPTVAGDWWVVPDGVKPVRYVLTGGRLRGHPYLGMPTRNWTSSQLIWIDRELGWARTASRLYKLEGTGQRRSDDEED